MNEPSRQARYTSDGALAECPGCNSLAVGSADNAVHCHTCGLTVSTPHSLQKAIAAWNTLFRRTTKVVVTQGPSDLRQAAMDFLNKLFRRNAPAVPEHALANLRKAALDFLTILADSEIHISAASPAKRDCALAAILQLDMALNYHHVGGISSPVPSACAPVSDGYSAFDDPEFYRLAFEFAQGYAHDNRDTYADWCALARHVDQHAGGRR